MTEIQKSAIKDTHLPTSL